MRMFKIKCDMCGKEEESAFERNFNFLVIKHEFSQQVNDFCSEKCVGDYYVYKLESHES